MAITAALVKELRERTGAGMMECKKALVETDGDLDTAIENMRKSGAAKADKKSGRVAAEGAIVVAISDDAKQAVMAEINSETDFVSKSDDFIGFINKVAQAALAQQIDDVAVLADAKLDDGQSVEDARQQLVAKIGENIQVRRIALFGTEGVLASYLHGVRIGVVVELAGGSVELGRDIAMHVAASKPVCIGADEVPAELLAKEREIITVQAAESGKPENIVEKMVDGRIKKYLNEVTLLGQPFVKDPDQTVEKLLAGAGASVVRFNRFEVGEGIEKKKENFAEEVAAQAKGQ
jgi:elongation factor Ts